LNNRLHNKHVNFGQSVSFSSTAAASQSSGGTAAAVAAGSAAGPSASSSLSLSLSPYDATRPSGPVTFGLAFFSSAALLYTETFSSQMT